MRIVCSHGLRGSLLFSASLSVFTLPVSAQVRGMPMFPESQFPYSVRISAGIGHGGELDGLALVGSAAYLIRQGTCNRWAVSAGAGVLNPGGKDFETHLNAGVAASKLLNRCPPAFGPPPNPSYWVVAGVGIVTIEDATVFNVPFGFGVGYKIELPGLHLEPWVVPRAQYRESVLTPGDSSWGFAFSAGVTLGLSGVVGLRVGADCCDDGIGLGYRISKWF